MPDYKIPTLTAAYIQLRDQRKALKDAFELDDALLKEKMTKIEVNLMVKLDAAEVTSFKTPHGTAYIQSETRFGSQDWDATWAWMIENNRPDLCEKRLNQGAIKDLEKEGIPLPPGVGGVTERVVRIRRT